jgi:hypothetical protein
VRDYEQHREPPHALDHEIEHFQRGRVRPMRILEQHQHWLLARETLHLIEQGRERLPALLRRREAERWITASERDRQHGGDQGGDRVRAIGRESENFL